MPQPVRPRRSALYVPASNERALRKAATLDADVVIIDLEDAVAPEAKAAARDSACALLRERPFGPRESVLRLNAPGTPWFADDIAAAARCAADAVLVPKVEGPADVAAIAQALAAAGAPAGLTLWAMIETPRALLALGAIAALAADPALRLACFVAGTNDLAKETGARLKPGRAALLPWLSQIVLAARAHGLVALDGVCNAIADAERFAAEAEQGRDLGFDGKTVIHPGQIGPANAAFGPSEEEIAEAEAIVAAFARPENAGRGVVSLDGRMVERLHVEMAARTLALVEAIRVRSG